MTRPAGERARKKALDDALLSLFSRLRARPVPDRLKSVIEQLDEAEARPERKTARG